MKRFSRLTLLAIGVVVVLLWRLFNFGNQIDRQNFKDIELAINNNAVDSSYEIILEDAIAVLGEIDPIFSTIDVNSLGKRERLSIVVFDSRRPASDRKTIFDYAKNNMISVGDRYIIVDASFLDVILVNSINELMSALEVDVHSARGWPLQRMYGQYRVRQLANISTWATQPSIASDLIDTGKLRRAFELLRSPIERRRMVQMVANSPDTPEAGRVLLRDYESELYGVLFYIEYGRETLVDEFPMQRVYSVPFAGSLFFPLAHELYHIREGQTAAFQQKVVDSSALAEARRIEANADAYALDLLGRVVGRSPFIKIGNFSYDIRRGAYLVNQLFSDITFARRLDGLRGLNSYAFGVFIEYVPQRDCDAAGMRRGYFDQEEVVAIKSDRFPLLSQREWQEFQLAVQRERSNSHPHEVSRAIPLQRIAADYFDRVRDLSQLDTPVRAALVAVADLESTLDKAYKAQVGNLSPGIGLDPRVLLSMIRGAQFVEVEAAFCPYSQCLLYEIDEIWAGLGIDDKNRIVQFDYIVPVFASDPQFLSPNSQFNKAAVKSERMERAFELLRGIIGYFQDEVFPNRPVDRLAGSFARDFFGCGGGSFSVTDGRQTLRASTLDEQFSMKLSYFAGVDDEGNRAP